MNLWPFKRTPAPDPVSQAARQLALQGVERRKAKIRATCDRMNAEMGKPPIVWPS